MQFLTVLVFFLISLKFNVCNTKWAVSSNGDIKEVQKIVAGL